MLSLRFVFTHKSKSHNFYCYDIDNDILYLAIPNLIAIVKFNFSNEGHDF